MKNIGKPFTIIFIVVSVLVGLAFLIFAPERFNGYMQLMQFAGVPLLVIMGGIAGQSIAKVIKGESTISDASKEIADGK